MNGEEEMGYFNFTKRIPCGACRSVFTITSAASKYCKDRECISKRRKADRLARKLARDKVPPRLPPGSDGHMERALKSRE